MTTFRVSIECDNAAFDFPDREVEIARILREVANRVERWNDHETGKAKDLRDINGNTVGQFWLEVTP